MNALLFNLFEFDGMELPECEVVNMSSCRGWSKIEVSSVNA